MYNTVILYEHIYKDGIITINPIECIEKPKTFIRVDNKTFSPNFNRTLRVDDLNSVTIGYYMSIMYSNITDYDNFKQKIINYESDECKRAEEKLNKLREQLDDIINARLDS